MKPRNFIFVLLFVLAMLVACMPNNNDGPVETRHGTSQIEQVPEPSVPEANRRVEGPSLALSAIDSLMWRQPDSALALLLPYFDTCCRDVARNVYPENSNDNSEDVARYVSTAYNRHYAHLLLSELLYKNDYEQTNRCDLQKAVNYFDSLVCGTPHSKGGRGIKKDLSHPTNLVFLDARAHYINGVGYYERDSVVDACKEYLKALEVMEGRFEDKELVGKKAKFMTYIYNRLGDMFEDQYMLEPAINCFKHSYEFSTISPISSYSVSSALYRIGKQYNMMEDKDSAVYYYSQALVHLPDSTNLYYRDIVSTQALLLYQLTHQTKLSLKRLKQMTMLAADDEERMTRYVVIGNIFFEEKLYDSALVYLEPVFENKENKFLLKKVASYLNIIYDSLGNKEKHNGCMHYLATHNETGAENSALVSQLSDLYKLYASREQDIDARTKREMAVNRTLGVVIPIAVVLALAIIVAAKLRSKRLLIKQREEANRELREKEQRHQEELKLRQTETKKVLENEEQQHQLELEERDKQHAKTIEAERQAHRMEQAAISGRLKRKNEEVRELKDLIKRHEELDTTPKQAESFTDEPICRLILERVKKGQFKAQMDYRIYKDAALDKGQVMALRDVADRHLDFFTTRLKKAYPNLTNSDLDYCCLYLLGLSDADISALMQKAYSTVSQRSRKIKAILGGDSQLCITLKSIANNVL